MNKFLSHPDLPNQLSFFRLMVIPLIVVFYFLPWQWTACSAFVLFVLGAVSDFFDGYLSRKYQHVTEFGAFIDPVADKLFVAVTLIMVAYHTQYWLVLIAALVIVSREIVISALREWMAARNQREQVSVSSTGKLKTVLQMTALGLLILKRDAPESDLFNLGVLLLAGATIMSVISMWQYLNASKESLTVN